MILGEEILRYYIKKHKLIENFSDECLNGAGYDLRVERIYTLEEGGGVMKEKQKSPKIRAIGFTSYKLHPGEYILLETIEKVNLPLNIAARILPRSSIFRYGCGLQTAVVDPGFSGTLTIGMYNFSTYPFTLEKGARVAQIVFEEIKGKSEGYKGRYQGGKVV